MHSWPVGLPCARRPDALLGWARLESLKASELTYCFARRLAYVTEATVALVVGVVAGGAGTAEEAEATPCCSRVLCAYVLLLPCSTCLSVPAIPAAFLYYSWWRGERLPSSLVELNTEVGRGTLARHLDAACCLPGCHPLPRTLLRRCSLICSCPPSFSKPVFQ